MDAKEILQRMTLEEKINLCCGAGFWKTAALTREGIEALTMSDGPHGVRYQAGDGDMLGINNSAPATCFPTAVTSACSWNPELISEMVAAIAEEAAVYGVDVLLGPGLNMKRNPLCGRNFEYFSEDPYLAGKLGAAFVRGGQQKGTSTCVKHFAANSQEYKRFSSDSQMDERTLRELYLPAFETAVKEGDPDFVMCAYNKLNGTYCSDHKKLLTDILREEWHFSGAVMTDWGAMHHRAAGFLAGCDLSMPGGSTHHQRHALEAVRRGELPEEAVDTSAQRMLERMLHAQTVRAKNGKEKMSIPVDRHHEQAKRVARESIVLLKNDEILPLKKTSVCLVGVMADTPRYQGAGSSHIQPARLTSLREITQKDGWGYVPGCYADGSTSEELLEQVRKAAGEADTIIVTAGLTEQTESEGFDRADMKMPEGHLRMIAAAAEANPDTVVLLVGGSPMELPWFEAVKGVMYLGLPGQAGYEAAYELLTGVETPSGKLAESWPYTYQDVINHAYYSEPFQNAQYLEGIYVGYRYYESAGVPVRFPFGYGLSYTKFHYSDLAVEKNKVTVTVENCGTYKGAEAVQLYIAQKNPQVHRPARELKGFQKVFLQPGEKKTIVFALNPRSFALWQDGWKIPEGHYEIQIGSSVEEIQLTASLELSEANKKALFGEPADFLKHDFIQKFEKIPKHAQQQKAVVSPGNYTMENSILEMAESSRFVKAIHFFMERAVAKSYGIKPDYTHPEFKMSMAASADSALFCAVNNGGKLFPEYLAQALLYVANRRFLRALYCLIFRK